MDNRPISPANDKHRERLTAEHLANLNSRTPGVEDRRPPVDDRRPQVEDRRSPAEDRRPPVVEENEPDFNDNPIAPQHHETFNANRFQAEAGCRDGEFAVRVQRTPNNGQEKKLVGMQVRPDPEYKVLRVQAISDGLINDWNMSNPAYTVKKMATITEVNRIRDDAKRMLQEIKTARELTMLIRRQNAEQ